MQDQSNLNRGYFFAFLSAVVLSTTAVFIRYIFNTYQMPPLVLACWRDALAAVSLLIILLLFHPSLITANRDHANYLLIYGFILALFNSLWTISVNLNGAAIATVLAYSSAAFTTLLDRWLFKEKLGLVKIFAVILSLFGCLLVSDALDPAAWLAHPLGIVTGTLAGLSYAIYTLMGRSAHKRGINTWTTLLHTFIAATFFLFILNMIPNNFIPGAASQPEDLLWLGTAWDGWGILLILAAGPTLAGFGLYNTSLNYLPSSVVNLIVTLEPVFTATFAYLFLKEKLSRIQIIGSSIILIGIVFLRLYNNSSKEKK